MYKGKFMILFLLFLLLLLHLPNFAHREQPQPINCSYQLAEALNRMPLYFVENKGQLPKNVKYQLKKPNANVYFTPYEIVYCFVQPETQKIQNNACPGQDNVKRAKHSFSTMRLRFIGASDQMQVEGIDKSAVKMNFFLGNDSRKWVRGAETFHKILYKDLYPHVDFVVCGRNGMIKHEYIVKAGGKVENIKFHFEGMDSINVNKEGQLEIISHDGKLIEDKPVSYQIVDSKKVNIETNYVLLNNHTIGFRAANYLKNRELIIDPLLYSTFLGGNQTDEGFDIAISDKKGSAFITGRTSSSNFPATPGAYDTSWNSGDDVFITQLNASGTGLIFSTYLGGSDNDFGADIFIDSDRNIFITGGTRSNDFPTTPGAYDTSHNGMRDAFLVKLNSSGTNLIHSTYIGGTGNEDGEGIVVDSKGYSYVAGDTMSADFPTTHGAFDESFNGNQDIFVSKLNPSMDGLDYSTFLGGSNWEYHYGGISVDTLGYAYLTGRTYSSDFPTSSGTYDESFNGKTDAFVTKLNPSGSGLTYSTFVGGSELDDGFAIALDQSGHAYITGPTKSNDFPTTAGAFRTALAGTYDVFITKLNSNGKSILYSTYLGGSFYDEETSQIAVDRYGNAFVTGGTSDNDFPTTANALDGSWNGSYDAFVTKINTLGANLVYSTYLGGSDADWPYGLVVDKSGYVYVAGKTRSIDFPTTVNAYDTTYNGGFHDVFVSKIPVSRYTLAIGAGPGGTTSPRPGVYVHPHGKTVYINALPDSVYRFNNWRGDAAGTANPLSLTMDIDKEITAVFTRLAYPPLDFSGEKKENRSLLMVEYINVLEWQANPANQNIEKYRIYVVEGISRILLAELNPTVSEYWHRNVDKNKQYSYTLVAVKNGIEGESASLTIK